MFWTNVCDVRLIKCIERFDFIFLFCFQGTPKKTVEKTKTVSTFDDRNRISCFCMALLSTALSLYAALKVYALFLFLMYFNRTNYLKYMFLIRNNIWCSMRRVLNLKLGYFLGKLHAGKIYCASFFQSF